LSTDVAPLIEKGKVMSDSRAELGRVGVGIAIPRGKRKPDFSTVDAFRRELLDAKAIATSGEGSSGRYVLALLDRLGIAAQVKPKIKSGAAGDAAHLVARGEVDFAVIGLPPLVGVAGIELSAGRNPELARVHRRHQQRGEGACRCARAGALSHHAGGDRGVQAEGIGAVVIA
jgi:molybdate transport system substrate-binding protein